MLTSSMISCESVSKTVATSEGELCILDAISFSIEKSETVAITGPSGSGKSTLLGILAGLDTPTSGKVFLNGICLSAIDEEARARVRGESVGFIFQSFQLLPGLTALENVMLPLELHGKKDCKTQAQMFLQRVGLGLRTQHYPKQLSGGEQQRVAIARAFAAFPQVLFADEPTGNLDSVTGSKIIELLFELNREQGTTLILVTHEQRLAERCQRRLSIVDGQLAVDSQGV